MNITVHGKPVTLTQETILKTRQYYADNAEACIAEAVSGEVRVNDLPSYIIRCEQRGADSLAGKNDHTFTFIQMAWYIQSGECVSLL